MIKQAIEVLQSEAEGILGLIDKIDESFTEMVNLIFISIPEMVRVQTWI